MQASMSEGRGSCMILLRAPCGEGGAGTQGAECRPRLPLWRLGGCSPLSLPAFPSIKLPPPPSIFLSGGGHGLAIPFLSPALGTD